MEEIRKTPPVGLAGLNDSGCLHQNISNSDKDTNPTPKQEAFATAAIKTLSLEAAVEAAHIAAISARHFVENCEIGDYQIAEHNLRVACAHLREACAQFRSWQGQPLPQREAQHG